MHNDSYLLCWPRHGCSVMVVSVITQSPVWDPGKLQVVPGNQLPAAFVFDSQNTKGTNSMAEVEIRDAEWAKREPSVLLK